MTDNAPILTAARLAHIPVPLRMRHLPTEARGYHVPRFVLWAEGDPGIPANQRPPGVGTPHFKIMDSRHFTHCIKLRVCWICGQPLGRFMSFVIGPMCAVNRVSSEPPSHRECALYAAQVCPFLAIPEMRRLPCRGSGEPTAAGVPIDRNPGVACLWTTRQWKAFRTHLGNTGVLFNIGEPERVEWFARGRAATRAEVIASIDSGLPALEKITREKEHPSDIEPALAELAQMRDRVNAYLPGE